ncbi:MAG: AmmeMemoRadiSam system protein B [Planctomycetota bacterium]
MTQPAPRTITREELRRLYPDSFTVRMRRSIQPVPVQLEGGQMLVLLTDHSQVAPGQATMGVEMFEIVMALEAAGSIGALVQQAVAAGMGIDFGDAVRKIVAELDQALMIEGPQFEAFCQQYRKIPTRPAVNAGRCYPEDAVACAAAVAEWRAGKYARVVPTPDGLDEETPTEAAEELRAPAVAPASKLGAQLLNPQASPGLKQTKGGILVPAGFEDLDEEEPVPAEAAPEDAAADAAMADPDDPANAPPPIVTEPAQSARAAGDARRVVGMVAPHIDLRRGGPCVAAAYRELRRPDGSYPALAVVLGTCHHPTRNLATTTGKTFTTPLGDVEVQPAALQAFAKALPFDPFEEEYLFMADFPCEFQALFLADLNARDQAKMQILPVIVGSLEGAGCGMNLADADPHSAEPVQAVVRAIQAAVAAVGGDAVVIASADLSHVGERFENPPVTPELLKEVQASDLEALAKLETVDADGFAAAVLKPGNPTNICSTAVIYLTAAALAKVATRGRLIRHEISPESSSQSAVSFASLVLEG